MSTSTLTRTILSTAILSAFTTGALAENWNTSTTITNGQTTTVNDGRIEIQSPGNPSGTNNVLIENGGKLHISDADGNAYITGRVDVRGQEAVLKGRDGITNIKNLTTGALILNDATVELTGNLIGKSAQPYYVNIHGQSSLKVGGDITGNFASVHNQNSLEAGSITVDGSFSNDKGGTTTLSGTALTAKSISNKGDLKFTNTGLVTVKATTKDDVIQNIGNIQASGDLKFESTLQHGRSGNDYDPKAFLQVTGKLSGAGIRNLAQIEAGSIDVSGLSNSTNVANQTAQIKAGSIKVTGHFSNGSTGYGGVVNADSINAGSYTQVDNSSTNVTSINVLGKLDVKGGTLTASQITAETFSSGAGSVITFDKLNINANNPNTDQTHGGWLKSGDQNLVYNAKLNLSGKLTNKDGGALDSLTINNVAVFGKNAVVLTKKLTANGLNNQGGTFKIETVQLQKKADGSAGYLWNVDGSSFEVGTLTAASISNGPNSAKGKGTTLTVDNLVVSDSVSLHRTETGEKGVLTVNNSASIGTLKNAGEVNLIGTATISEILKGKVQGQNKAKNTGTITMKDAVVTVQKASEFGDLTMNNSSLSVGSGEHAIGTLKGSSAEIVVSDIKGTSVKVTKTSTDNDLTLRATGTANDSYANADAAMDDLQKVMTSGDKIAAQTVVLDQGGVNDGKTATFDQNGNMTSSTTQRNTTVESYGDVNVLSALLWRDTLNDLNRRMGELRDSPQGVGAWVRFYGGEQEYSEKSVKMKTTSIQVGSDVDVCSGFKVGGAFSYSDGSSSFMAGTGDHKIYSLAAYGTWFGESGRFLDLIARVSRLETEFTAMSTRGDYDNTGWSLSAEYGRRFSFAQGAFVEPQVELTYGRIDGADFATNNDIRIEQNAFDSLIARAGVRTGFVFPENKGTVYGKFSVAHDFLGETDATLTKGGSLNTYEADVGGTWIQYGFGANFNWTERTYTYVDFERSNLGEVKDNYKWSVGLRHVF